MDAGTDQGLAFTSPSWESAPQDPITQITHKFPNHPAASFAYPNKSALPLLATLSIVKVCLNLKQISICDTIHQKIIVLLQLNRIPVLVLYTYKRVSTIITTLILIVDEWKLNIWWNFAYCRMLHY